MSELIYVQMPGRWEQIPIKPKPIDPDKIIETVTGFYNVSFVRVCGKDRYRNIVRARHMIYYFLRTLTKEHLVDIADRMNRRDHTAISHGVNKIKTFYTLYPDVKYEVDTLKFKLTDKKPRLEPGEGIKKTHYYGKITNTRRTTS